MNDHGHRFAVFSPVGYIIELYDDGATAERARSELPDSYIEELVTIEHHRKVINWQANASRTLQKHTLETVRHLEEKDRSEYNAAKTLDSERDANAILTDEVERLEAKLAAVTSALTDEHQDNLWNAYNSGHEKDGWWTHCFMSDGEWLARECGLDPKQGHYDAKVIKNMIPKIVHPAIRGNND